VLVLATTVESAMASLQASLEAQVLLHRHAARVLQAEPAPHRALVEKVIIRCRC